MTISEAMESLINKLLSDENIDIGIALYDSVEYSVVTWDLYHDDYTINLLYNGNFKLWLSTWNEEGKNIFSIHNIVGDEFEIIPIGLKNLMETVYLKKEPSTFQVNQLL